MNNLNLDYSMSSEVKIIWELNIEPFQILKDYPCFKINMMWRNIDTLRYAKSPHVTGKSSPLLAL